MSVPANQIVSVCIEDLRTRLQSIAALEGTSGGTKVLVVFSEDDLADKVKGIKSLPAVGIVYEGMRALPEQGAAKVGVSAEVVFSLAIMNRVDGLVNADVKTPALNILEDIRAKMINTRSPTGHFWRFVVEANASQKSGIVFWVQRWATPIQLIPKN